MMVQERTQWLEARTCPTCHWTGSMVHLADSDGVYAICDNREAIEIDADDCGHAYGIKCPRSLHGDGEGFRVS